MEPEVLLLDEPENGLDTRTRAQLMEILRRPGPRLRPDLARARVPRRRHRHRLHHGRRSDPCSTGSSTSTSTCTPIPLGRPAPTSTATCRR
ncbi:MAG: hypothetical protein MZV70_06495 [Desulfobacterales bacterium]|nr:hypothetical protein [Desulfobacterales bacterium]